MFLYAASDVFRVTILAIALATLSQHRLIHTSGYKRTE
jgi:hypothetical protein